MKEYLLFVYDQHYPCGGMNDFVDCFDTIEEAVKHHESIKTSHSNQYFQVVKYSTMEIVREY